MIPTPEFIYHMITLDYASRQFSQVIPLLQIQDHISSFEMSVRSSPIDSTLEIIQFFLTEMQDKQLLALGDPRQLYAPHLHKRLKQISPVLASTPPSMSFAAPDIPVDIDKLDEITLKQFKPPVNISHLLQSRFTQLEKYLQIKLQPWKICCYEYISKLLSPILLDFNPRACYIDSKLQHNYKLYSHPSNVLTPEDLQLPKFFDLDRLRKMKEFEASCAIMSNMAAMSPSQSAFALAVIYRNIEYCVGKMLETYEVEKARKRREQELLQQQMQAELTSPTPSLRENRASIAEAVVRREAVNPRDFGMNFISDSLTVVNDTESMNNETETETSSFQQQQLEVVVEAPTALPAQPKAFGADEMMPGLIFLILETKPTELMRQIALVETFCLSFFLNSIVEYALRMIEGAAVYVSNGFAQFKPIQRGVVPPKWVITQRVLSQGEGDPLLFQKPKKDE